MMTIDELRYANDRDLTHKHALGLVHRLSALVESRGDHTSAAMFHRGHWPDDRELVTRAAVAAGSTGDAAWAAPLAPPAPLLDGFVELLRGRELLGRIPGLRKVAFNVSMSVETSGASFTFVGEGAVTPLSSMALKAVMLSSAPKVVGIVPITEELFRSLSAGNDAALRDTLLKGAATVVDKQFCDPTIAPVVNDHPGGITNGITPVPFSGASPSALQADVDAVLDAWDAANPDAERCVLLMPPRYARLLAGAAKTDRLLDTGGEYHGVTVVTSASVGARVIALDPGAVLYADAGAEFDVSRNATVQYAAPPDSPPTAASIQTSLWQNNQVGVKCLRHVNWTRCRDAAVQFVAGTYSSTGT